jgi:hypothetical protein
VVRKAVEKELVMVKEKTLVILVVVKILGVVEEARLKVHRIWDLEVRI